MFGEVAYGFDAEYFDDDIVGGKVFIEQVVVLVLSVDGVDLCLVVEAFVEVFDDVLDHHDFELHLLAD